MKNKKILSSLLIVLLLISVVSGCNKNEKEISVGTFEGNNYINEYFGFTMELPQEWHMVTDEEKEFLLNASGEVISENNEDLAEQIDLSKEKIIYLVWAYKYPLTYTDGYNPSFLCMGENLGLFNGTIIKTGEDYIEATKKTLDQTGLEYQYDEITTEKIGDKNFDVMEMSLDYQGIKIYQKYYVTIINKYALVYILSYTTEEQKEELTNILNTASFVD